MNPLGLPVWDLGDGAFLLDDLDVAYEAFVGAEADMRAMLMDDGFEGNGSSPAYAFSTNGLWLEVSSNSMAVSNQFSFILHNAVHGQPYEILTKTNLADPDWTGELWISSAVGTIDTNQLARNGRTNLFVWACSCRLTVDTNSTPLQLAQLMGTCVTIGNARYTGADVP